LPRVEGVDRLAHELDDALSITIEAKSGQASASDWKRLAGPRYGIEPADQAYALSVGGTDSTVFINRDLNRSSTGLLELLQRPWIAAVIGRRSLEGSTVVSKFVVLTRPVGESARIDVVRRDGVITYTGTASWFGGQMAFMVSDVDRPGTVPTKVAGKLTAQGIKLDVGLLSSVRVGTRSAVPVVTAPEN
jgi:hypothetical protein